MTRSPLHSHGPRTHPLEPREQDAGEDHQQQQVHDKSERVPARLSLRPEVAEEDMGM